MLLDGKVAIITGVGAGLGGAAAEAFAREGAAVALVARTESHLEEVAGKIEADGGRALVVPGSVSDAGRCSEIAALVAAELGGIDCLVNSAFRNDPGVAFEDADLDQWRKVFDINVFGTLKMTQAAIPHLKARGGGSIVNIGSMGSRKIRPNSGAYTTSKGALLTATQVLAKELGPFKIRVNTVVPGWIWGPNVQWYVQHEAEERGVPQDDVLAELVREIPLGFVPPQEDIANAIVFFASDWASVITGQALDVNGGEYFH